MKLLLVVLALAAASQAASLPRKSFRENTEDFIDIIIEEAGEQFEALYEAYQEDAEFQQTQAFLEGQNFANLIAEMEALPEFNALIDFIEEDGIEIHFFLQLAHEALGWEAYEWKRMASTMVATGGRQATGTGHSGFIRDVIDALPQERLEALFNEKLETDDEFRVTIDNLYSQEYSDLWDALWANETFAAEIQAIADAGVDIDLLTVYIKAVFGAPRD